MTNIDPNEFIQGGESIPSAKFDAIGDTVKGTVTDFDVNQCRKFGTNELEFWDDGKPKMQLVVTLATELRDPTKTDDDGRRRIYAPRPSNKLTAIAEALKTADGTKLKIEVGGTLAMRFTAQRPHEKPGFNPIKEFAAAYAPPVNKAADDLLGDASPAAPAAGQPVDELV